MDTVSGPLESCAGLRSTEQKPRKRINMIPLAYNPITYNPIISVQVPY